MTAARERLEVRHREVLGEGPRMAPVDREDAAESVRDSAVRLTGAVGGDPAAIRLDRLPEIMFTMSRLPGLWNRLIELTVELQGPSATLPARDRELAILRTGWLCQAPYEFGEHVKLAKRMGLAGEEIERVIAGSAEEGWTSHERAILRAVEELHEGAMVSDDTWRKLADTFDEAQMIELLVLVGQFTATAYFQNSLRLRLERGNEGLMAR